MRTALLAVLIGLTFLEREATAQPPDFQTIYVATFVEVFAKRQPILADYFLLFEEPEGPEGTSRYLAIRNLSSKQNENVDSRQEMSLAAEIFDRLLAEDRNNPSPYLLCVKDRYRSNLPIIIKNPLKSIDVEHKTVDFVVPAKKGHWKLVFSFGERKPDSIIAPDGIQLGDRLDPCVRNYKKPKEEKSNGPGSN